VTRYTPVPKIVAVGLGGAVATLLVWAASAVADVTVPAEVAAALTGLLAFAFGYLKAPADHHSQSDAGYSLAEIMVAAFFAVLIVLVLVRLL
jgi:hypothetical protein